MKWLKTNIKVVSNRIKKMASVFIHSEIENTKDNSHMVNLTVMAN
jgi:hypothetical protein